MLLSDVKFIRSDRRQQERPMFPFCFSQTARGLESAIAINEHLCSPTVFRFGLVPRLDGPGPRTGPQPGPGLQRPAGPHQTAVPGPGSPPPSAVLCCTRSAGARSDRPPARTLSSLPGNSHNSPSCCHCIPCCRRGAGRSGPGWSSRRGSPAPGSWRPSKPHGRVRRFTCF